METVSTKACVVEGCKRPYRAKGYCNVHFKKWRRGEMPKKRRYKICSEENCRKPLFRFGKCETHYKVEPPKETPKEIAPTAKPEAAAAQEKPAEAKS